ncbi:MAG: LamG domain-containing protein [Chloroflexi bacterium]|nr:LamG domain-containing protein [Chloroflexota bacterium]
MTCLSFPVAILSSTASYLIDQSIRFNDDDSAYMYRTPSVAGNRKTWTWSGWVKFGLTGFTTSIFSSGTSSTTDIDILRLDNNGALTLILYQSSTIVGKITTTRLLRDPSAWYHITAVVDTTNVTAGDRMRLYINGVEETDFSTDTNPAINLDTLFNNTIEHNVGRNAPDGTQEWDGYLADVHFVDGAALTASDFGEVDANGNWVPIAFDSSAVTTLDFVAPADGTNIGDMTSAGGLAAAFDGTLHQASGSSAYVANVATGFVGKNWGAARLVSKAYVHASTNAGFNNDSTTADVKISLEGSTTGSWGGEEVELDSTLLGGDGYTGWNNATAVLTYSGSTEYQYHRILIDGTTANVWPTISEIEFVANGTGYGTNGFHIDGADSADLGNDISDKNNDFATSGLTPADQMLDSPTDYVASNYPTWNPLQKGSTITLSEANLAATGTAAQTSHVTSTQVMPNGSKTYFEIHMSATNGMVGIILDDEWEASHLSLADNSIINMQAAGGDIYDYPNGPRLIIGYGASWAGAYTVMVAVDLENDEIYFGNADTDLWSDGAGTYDQDWDTGTPSPISLQTLNADWKINCRAWGGTHTLNTGQSAFAGTIPSGYITLCTANLPAPTPAADVTPITSPSFTGTADTSGVSVWLGYTPDTSGTSTINGNTITWGTHALPMAGGMLVITSSSSYNSTGTNTISIAVKHPFGGAGVSQARAQ